MSTTVKSPDTGTTSEVEALVNAAYDNIAVARGTIGSITYIAKIPHRLRPTSAEFEEAQRAHYRTLRCIADAFASVAAVPENATARYCLTLSLARMSEEYAEAFGKLADMEAAIAANKRTTTIAQSN